MKTPIPPRTIWVGGHVIMRAQDRLNISKEELLKFVEEELQNVTLSTNVYNGCWTVLTKNNYTFVMMSEYSNQFRLLTIIGYEIYHWGKEIALKGLVEKRFDKVSAKWIDSEECPLDKVYIYD